MININLRCPALSLPRYLHGTAESTVLPVTLHMSTPGVSRGAAPGWVEPSGSGTGSVNHATVDEGEPAGGRTGGAGGGEGAVVLTVPPVASEMVGEGVSSCTAPGFGEPTSSGAGGERHSLVDEGEHTGGLCHGSCRVSVTRA